MSQPAVIEAGIALRRSIAMQYPPMMVASDVMTPLKPSRPRSTPVSSSGLSEAGRQSSSRSAGLISIATDGCTMCPTMTLISPRPISSW